MDLNCVEQPVMFVVFLLLWSLLYSNRFVPCIAPRIGLGARQAHPSNSLASAIFQALF